MIFRKQKKSDQAGTRSERMRSKSVENILEAPGHKYQQKTDDTSACGKWKELDEVRRVHPVVTCVIPSLAMDFVASALLAVGATPLVTEGMFCYCFKASELSENVITNLHVQTKTYYIIATGE